MCTYANCCVYELPIEFETERILHLATNAVVKFLLGYSENLELFWTVSKDYFVTWNIKSTGRLVHVVVPSLALEHA